MKYCMSMLMFEKNLKELGFRVIEDKKNINIYTKQDFPGVHNYGAGKVLYSVGTAPNLIIPKHTKEIIQGDFIMDKPKLFRLVTHYENTPSCYKNCGWRSYGNRRDKLHVFRREAMIKKLGFHVFYHTDNLMISVPIKLSKSFQPVGHIFLGVPFKQGYFSQPDFLRNRDAKTKRLYRLLDRIVKHARGTNSKVDNAKRIHGLAINVLNQLECILNYNQFDYEDSILVFYRALKNSRKSINKILRLTKGDK